MKKHKPQQLVALLRQIELKFKGLLAPEQPFLFDPNPRRGGICAIFDPQTGLPRKNASVRVFPSGEVMWWRRGRFQNSGKGYLNRGVSGPPLVFKE
jgi:hypothetical protein